MSIIAFFIFLSACVAAGATAAIIRPGQWYERLRKPVWTPPNWAFPVVWSCLYLCMSWAGARIVDESDNEIALALWSLQIALNALWTPVFFGLRDILGGLYVVLALWVAVFATMIALALIDVLAGLLFLPYLCWVSIASMLNYTIWRMNPDERPLRDIDI